MDNHQDLSFNNILFCGCSYAFGDELQAQHHYFQTGEKLKHAYLGGKYQFENRYSRLVANHFGAKDFNLSGCGFANDLIVAKTVEFVNDQFHPDLAIIQFSHPTRFLGFDNMYGWRSILPSGTEGDMSLLLKTAEKFFYKYVYHDKMAMMHYWRNMYLLQEMFKAKGIEYFFLRCAGDTTPDDLFHPYLDRSRILEKNMWQHLLEQYNPKYRVSKIKGITPGGHPNELGHKKIADYLINTIEQYYSHVQRLSR